MDGFLRRNGFLLTAIVLLVVYAITLSFMERTYFPDLREGGQFFYAIASALTMVPVGAGYFLARSWARNIRCDRLGEDYQKIISAEFFVKLDKPRFLHEEIISGEPCTEERPADLYEKAKMAKHLTYLINEVL